MIMMVVLLVYVKINGLLSILTRMWYYIMYYTYIIIMLCFIDNNVIGRIVCAPGLIFNPFLFGLISL